MRLPFTVALAFLPIAGTPLPVRAEPVEARAQSEGTVKRHSARSERTAEERVKAIDAVARHYALAGEVLVAKGNRILLHRGYGTIAPGGGAPHAAGARWRLASITKQVTAAMLVRQYVVRDASLRLLDAPLEGVLGSATLDGLTRRQLLTHHSGLANPDDTPATNGVPAFYAAEHPDLRYCVSRPAKPGAPFAYNNCDYLLAHSLQATTPHYGFGSWPAGMAMARAGEVGVPGFVGGKPEPRFQLASWDAAGGLIGTARAVFDFDRALMTGRFLPRRARDELWKPEGNGSYQALGAWVFPGTLAGCAAPMRIVQRDGEIWGVQARNFILPDDDMVVIVFTNRSSDDFAMGEVWQGKGFTYDLLSAAACQ